MKKDPRTKWLKIRVSESEKSEISAAAAAHQISESDLIRYGIKAAMTATPFDPPKPKPKIKATPESKDRQKLLLELARIGSNINQIARHLNSGSDINTLAALCRIQTMLDELRKSECTPNS